MVVIASSRYAYSNVGTSTWVPISLVDGAGVSIAASAMPKMVSEIEVFDSSGRIMEMGAGDGSSGGTTRLCLIPPGGASVPVKQIICAGSVVYLRAVDAAATSGNFVADFFHGRR